MSAMEYGGPERRRGGPDRRGGGEITRILIVDDHALFRVGIANILAREPDLEVVGEADDARSAVDPHGATNCGQVATLPVARRYPRRRAT